MRTGDIFEVITDKGTKKYFQYIAKDISDLHSDVIRIFKKEYDLNDSPSSQDIVNGEIDTYMHTYIQLGIKAKLWRKYDWNRNIGALNIYFRDAKDYGQHPGEKFVSKQWEVWIINSNREYVGILPDMYYNSYPGLVSMPNAVIHRINYGEYKAKFYPDYK